MAKKERIVKYTNEELVRLTKQKGSRSNWAKAAKLTKAEIEARVAADADEAGMVMYWKNATVDMPRPKAILNMRVDRDVLDYFRKTGRGYQTRINAVLRAFVESRHHRAR